MVYMKWQCKDCKEIVISNSKRHHEMNSCKKGCSFVDLEDYGCRMGGCPKTIKTYDYNFFDELVVCMFKQDFKIPILIDEDLHLPFSDVSEIRKIEDELCEGLK